MLKEMQEGFEKTGENPFDLPSVIRAKSLKDIERIHGPKAHHHITILHPTTHRW